jgi:hypothetical protein
MDSRGSTLESASNSVSHSGLMSWVVKEGGSHESGSARVGGYEVMRDGAACARHECYEHLRETA